MSRLRPALTSIIPSTSLVLLSYLLAEPTHLIILFLSYVLLTIKKYGKNSIFDPRVLLISLITIYSIWFPLQVMVIGYDYIPIDKAVLSETIRLQFFAVIIFTLVTNILIKNESKNDISYFFEINNIRGNNISDKLAMYFILPLSVYALYSILNGGFSSKRELADSEFIIASIAELLFTFLYIILTFNVIRDRYFLERKVSIFIVALSFFFFIIAGERDIFFKVIIIIYMVSCDKRGLNSLYSTLLVVLAAVLLVPISQAFKAVMLSGEINISSVGLELILSNEFTSSGRNLYTLIYFGVENSFSYLFNDIARAAIPTILISDTGIKSTAHWFNSVYRFNNDFSGSSGWGFSLIGEGFLINGHTGIAIIMSIYAAIISYFYNSRLKSIYYYSFYMAIFLVSVYVLRADLANFLSQIFKVSGLAVLVLYFANRMFAKRKI